MSPFEPPIGLCGWLQEVRRLRLAMVRVVRKAMPLYTQLTRAFCWLQESRGTAADALRLTLPTSYQANHEERHVAI